MAAGLVIVGCHVLHGVRHVWLLGIWKRGAELHSDPVHVLLGALMH
jgi:hypothetical protein